MLNDMLSRVSEFLPQGISFFFLSQAWSLGAEVAQSALKYSLRGAELDSCQHSQHSKIRNIISEVTKSRSHSHHVQVDHSLGAPHQNQY